MFSHSLSKLTPAQSHKLVARQVSSQPSLYTELYKAWLRMVTQIVALSWCEFTCPRLDFRLLA